MWSRVMKPAPVVILGLALGFGCDGDSPGEDDLPPTDDDSVTVYGEVDHVEESGIVLTNTSSSGDWVHVATGAVHSCGIRSDGTIRCWGCEGYGNDSELCVEPPGTFLDLAVGDVHTCAIRSDGSAVCWGCEGQNDWGQCGEELGDFVGICAGTDFSYALEQTGDLLGWGDPGILEHTSAGNDHRAVGCGASHACVVTNDGGLYCWDELSGPTAIQGAFESVSVGGVAICAQREDGSHICWGCPEHMPSACEVPDGGYVSIVAGTYHNCGLRADGLVECWGCDAGNDFGQCLAPPIEFVSISAGWASNCGVTLDGHVTCWGCGGIHPDDPTVPVDWGQCSPP